jgi:hypothetical protein
MSFLIKIDLFNIFVKHLCAASNGSNTFKLTWTHMILTVLLLILVHGWRYWEVMWLACGQSCKCHWILASAVYWLNYYILLLMDDFQHTVGVTRKEVRERKWGQIRVYTNKLVLSRQVLYQLNHAPNLFFSREYHFFFNLFWHTSFMAIYYNSNKNIKLVLTKTNHLLALCIYTIYKLKQIISYIHLINKVCDRNNRNIWK